MMFWIGAVLIFVVMMAVLGVLPFFVVDFGADVPAYVMYATTVSMAVLSLVIYRLSLLSKMARSYHNYLIYITISIVLMAMLAVAGLRVMSYHYVQTQALPSHSMRVSAVVHIDEISDSVYDEIGGTAYRQKAVLTDITPIGSRTNSKHPNPIYHEARAKAHKPANNTALPAELTVLLSAYPNAKNSLSQLNALSAGTRVRMELELTAVRPARDVVGFDSYRWLMGRHIHATAKVLTIDEQSINAIKPNLLIRLQRLRYEYRQHFLMDWQSKPYAEQQADAITLSLLTGDRSLIDKQSKDLYQFAGMSHLLAISGTHVLFLALLVAGGLTWTLDRYGLKLYRYLPRWQLRWLTMVGVSLIYALFTGFDVPAVRTVYMLVAVGLARYLLFDRASFRILVVVGLAIAWLDPYVLWQAGFWLSFVAVALLLHYETADTGKMWHDKLIALVRLQAWLFVAMLPITMLIFGKVSLLGFFTNIAAVGLFGWVIVPLNLLAGVLFAWLPSVSALLWGGVSGLLAWVNDVLEILKLMQGQAWLIMPMGVGMAVLAMFALLPFMMVKVMPRYASLPMMCLCLLVFLQIKNTGTPQLVRLPNSQEVNAVLIYANQQAWLVLSDGSRRLNAAVLTDELLYALKKHGIDILTGVIVQQPDDRLADTAGGLSLAMPIYEYWQAGSNIGRRGKLIPRVCNTDRQWLGDGLSISVLTGWQQLPNDKMHDCSVLLQVEIGVSVGADRVKSVLINGVRDDKQWRLWQMICQAEKTAVPQVELWIGKTPRAFDTTDDIVILPKYNIAYDDLRQ
ncbi:MAG: ComEC/Rec2 family competence protein [Moraxella sp.]|nr:ComEC/Rec2 family competence protein [Moraxella sp.]